MDVLLQLCMNLSARTAGIAASSNESLIFAVRDRTVGVDGLLGLGAADLSLLTVL